MIYPDYKEVFEDGKESENLEFFLKDIPTIKVIRIISFISACLDFKIADFEIQNFILKELLRNLNRRDQLYISQKINSVSDRPKIVFHHVACLLILQSSILNFKSGNNTKLLPGDTRNILRAFLHCNTKYSNVMENFIPKLVESEDVNIKLGLVITMDIAQKFFNPEKDIFEQSYKLKEFDEFLKNDKEIGGDYYIEFLISKNIDNFLDIIKRIWNIYFKIFRTEKVFDYEKLITTIKVENNDNLIENYFSSFSIQVGNITHYKEKFIESDLDFKLIRNYPVFKLTENLFAVLNSNFLVDRIFHSLLFEYFNFIQQNGYSKNFRDFKSYYSEVFVEKFLLKRIIDFIFEKTKLDIKQPGDIMKIKDKHNKDYSDYYIRKGYKILLFECKDRIMKAETKYSYDFNKIREDLNEKFIKVGVDQLIEVIHSIKNREFRFDKLDGKDLEKLTILPIIVYTDPTYCVRGLNYIINNIFIEKLNQDILNFQVRNLIMIHIDTLINYQDLFHDKKVDLLNVFERYNKFIEKAKLKLVKGKNSSINDFLDFDSFLRIYLVKERKTIYSDKGYVKKIYKDLYT